MPRPLVFSSSLLLMLAGLAGCGITFGPPPEPAPEPTVAIGDARWSWQEAGRPPDNQRFLIVDVVVESPAGGPRLPLAFERFSLRMPEPEGVDSVFDLRAVKQASAVTPEVAGGCAVDATADPGEQASCAVAFEIEASPAPEELVYAPPDDVGLAARFGAIEEPVACQGFRHAPTDLCGGCMVLNCPTAVVQDCGASCASCAQGEPDADTCGCLASSCDEACAVRLDRHIGCERDLCREHCGDG